MNVMIYYSVLLTCRLNIVAYSSIRIGTVSSFLTLLIGAMSWTNIDAVHAISLMWPCAWTDGHNATIGVVMACIASTHFPPVSLSKPATLILSHRLYC